MQLKFSLGSLCISMLAGCGTYVPDLQEPYESKVSGQIGIQEIVDHTACEVKTSVLKILLDDADTAEIRAQNGFPPLTISWLRDWAAQITLTLTVEEKTNFGPGLAFSNIYTNAVNRFAHSVVTTGQSSSLGLAGAFSSDATRKETIAFYIPFKSFTDDRSLRLARQQRRDRNLDCTLKDGSYLKGDLKFYEFLDASTLHSSINGGIIPNFQQALTAERQVSKKDVLSHQVTFVIMYGANITPSLKLVDISANQGSSVFLGAQRVNTQDATITLGPLDKDGKLSTAAQNTILSAQIETSFRNALQSSRQ